MNKNTLYMFLLSLSVGALLAIVAVIILVQVLGDSLSNIPLY